VNSVAPVHIQPEDLLFIILLFSFNQQHLSRFLRDDAGCFTLSKTSTGLYTKIVQKGKSDLPHNPKLSGNFRIATVLLSCLCLFEYKSSFCNYVNPTEICRPT
jgi:hypothetical protein